MAKYDLHSDKAESFINVQHINDVLNHARKKCYDKAIIAELLAKAKKMEGLTVSDATLLLMNRDPQVTAEIFALAAEITNAYYGNRKVLFAPLYLSNYCINHCTYCPYHAINRTIPRKKMTQEEIKAEVIALQDMGHKRLALEAGEDPFHNPLEYILESIDTIYGIHHKAGSIRRVNVNIAATTIEEYKKLHAAKIGTYILFQETYNKKEYERLHPKGPKANYAWHTEAMDRAMQAGIEDVGLGVLFGLHNYAFEFVALLCHAKHLEWKYGAGPHTVSVPRLQPASDINLNDFKNGLPNDIFLKIIALIRIALPYTGMIISTRESEAIREQALKVGISQISGGSKTTVGGYAGTDKKTSKTAQFELSDERTLDEVVRWLMQLGYVPSFCTACYGKGRQGVDFMSICKKQEIHNFCTPNALLTLGEYLKNYASDTGEGSTKQVGMALLDAEKAKLPEAMRQVVEKRLIKAMEGDVKFL